MTDRKRSDRVGERVLHEPQNEEQPAGSEAEQTEHESGPGRR
jgi:hypothetical protein